MTDRETLRRVMAFEPVDKAPNYELGAWGQTVERWVAEGMPEDAVFLNWFEGEPFFNITRRAFAHINVGMIPAFEYEVLEETDRCVVARQSNGVVTRALKEGTVRYTRPCMDQYIGHPASDRESFRALKRRYDASSPTRYPLWWDEWVRIWRTRDYPLCLLGNGTFGLYWRLREWVGTEEISYLFFDDPGLVDEMLDFMAEFLLATVERALGEVQFDYFNFSEDCAGKGGPLISPDIFRRFFLRHYQRITGRLRQAGITSIWLDSDGDLEALIPLMLEAGITCLWPLEQASGMDPRRLRNRFGKDLALAGGIDKMEIAKGRKAIEAELTAKIPPLMESGGFLPHLDHAFPPDISYDNFLYYLEVKERLLGAG